jgi:hypothetical protein
MDELKNLKTMRDATWSRIKDTADYKVATHLDAMIPYLEDALNGKVSPDGEPADYWQENRLQARAVSLEL